MFSYIVRRLLMTIPVLIGVSILIFLLVHLTPGDPVYLMLGDSVDNVTEEDIDNLRETLGLNDPLPVQYLNFVTKFVTFDFGSSLRTRTLIKDEIFMRLKNTAQLAAVSIVLASVLGVSFGIIAGTNRGKLTDNIVMSVSMLGISAPAFVFALFLVLIFVSKLSLLPATGKTGPISFVLPAVSIGISCSASIARMTRSSVLEILNEDFIRTVDAKGVSRGKLLFKHVLRNASIPILTMIGLQFGGLLGGAVIIETVFAWPGIGKYLVDGINSKDFPVVQNCVMMIAIMFAFINLLVDILYGIMDPRISYD